jgi:large subunit ribosomal protein L18
MAALSTSSPELREKLKKDAGNVKGAVALGAALADLCKKSGISKVVFDRSGYLYHGRVKALAEAARKGGLQF